MPYEPNPTFELDDDFFLGLNRPSSVTPSESVSQIGNRLRQSIPGSSAISSSTTVAPKSSSSSSQPSTKTAPSTHRTLRHKASLSNLPKIPESELSSPPPAPSTNSLPVEIPPQDRADLIPLSSALARAQDTKARLATVHEGIRMAARLLHSAGIIPRNQPLFSDIKEFDNAIFARYTAASFLWNVLGGLTETEWLGKGKRFDDSLRRIKTLKGLGGSLRCWEGVVFEVLGLLDGVEEGRRVDGEVVGRALGRWRVGVPSRP
ncbi:hypothetical protein QBC44DRAFT_402101 [Cladorrhinum sp. PSN332]|nr:hypothetical protein QBC44DRAFT_402101 [Cladorrhinum sp. PSN332]